MPNILFISANEDFAQDLAEQISLYATGFNILREDDVQTTIDMIVLDDKSELLSSIRKEHPKTPVILLQKTGEGNLDTSVLNTVILKPFSLETLLNQIRAQINILDNSAEGYLKFNEYIVRPIKKDIYNQRNKDVVKLTEKEVSIIKYLYKCKDRIVTKNELLQEVWGYSPDASTHTIETHIYRLRQKVEQDNIDAQLILTEDGGYRLRV